jgi:transposase InsO family protein
MASRDSKKALAKKLGISRSCLYYESKMKVRDECLKEQILATLTDHPSYGHKRLAIHLGRNKKCILRVMKKYGIKPYRRRGKRPWKLDDLKKHPVPIPNYAKTLCPLQRNILWASDFTYFRFHGKWWYLCTVLDIFSREIVGFSFSSHHDQELILSGLRDALNQQKAPTYLHTDQGSEYQSCGYFDLLDANDIKASFSSKASPWQNGYQESFYSEFKKDLGDISRFETIGEFMEGLYRQIHYYNTRRIHSALKVPPALFRQQVTH